MFGPRPENHVSFSKGFSGQSFWAETRADKILLSFLPERREEVGGGLGLRPLPATQGEQSVALPRCARRLPELPEVGRNGPVGSSAVSQDGLDPLQSVLVRAAQALLDVAEDVLLGSHVARMSGHPGEHG